MNFFSSGASKGLILSLLFAVPAVAAFSFGDDLRHAFNNAADRGTPLDRRDVITHRDNGQYSSVISGKYISRTGSVPDHAAFSPANLLQARNIDIDLKADDPFTRALTRMELATTARILQQPDLRALMAKKDWTPADRMAWDQTVAEMIAQAVERTPGLRYRTPEEKNGVAPLRHLNNLSSDLLNDTARKEFDCEGLSVVKVILQQRMADRFLSADQKSNYFYVSGTGELSLYEDTPGGHAFIVMEKDGQVTGVIEATDDSFVCRAPAAPISFADFTNGKPIVTRNGGVYGFDFTHEQADKARTAAGVKPYAVMMQEMKQNSRLRWLDI